MTEQEKKLRIRAQIDSLIRKMKKELRVFFEKQKDKIVNRVLSGEDLITVMQSMKPEEDSNLIYGIILPYAILADKRGFKIVTGKDKQDILSVEKFAERNKSVNQTTIESIQSKIDSSPDLPKEQIVNDYYNESANARSKTIATSTINGAYNQGQLSGARFQSQQLPSVIKNIYKKWVTQHDFRVRDAHADADGQTVKYDDDFVVGGENLEYPGDPTGSIENTINCRCFLITVTK